MSFVDDECLEPPEQAKSNNMIINRLPKFFMKSNLIKIIQYNKFIYGYVNSCKKNILNQSCFKHSKDLHLNNFI
ncbi:hypothetical protein D3C81_2192940 [compost metagenome]